MSSKQQIDWNSSEGACCAGSQGNEPAAEPNGDPKTDGILLTKPCENLTTHGGGHGTATLAEGGTLLRASISSIIATIVDGFLYQGVLSLVSSYVLAALVGAVAGAITNFFINRRWAFPLTAKKIGHQAAQYAVASALTYAGLQSALFVLIELIHINQRIAWLPAKIAAWLFVSYPLHRFVVFARPKSQ